MGNCLRTSNNKVLSNDDEDEKTQMELAQSLAPKNNLEQVIKNANKKNRVVRFAGEEDRQERSRGESKTGVVRVRLVVTQEELKKLLDYKKSDSKFTSLEQLLSEMKLRGTSVLGVEKNDGNCVMNGNNWSPALESIPEDDH